MVRVWAEMLMPTLTSLLPDAELATKLDAELVEATIRDASAGSASLAIDAASWFSDPSNLYGIR